MNSRERIRATINHKLPDRIPIDWGNLLTSGIHEIAYRNLLDYLDIEEEIRIHDPVQGLAVVSEKILDLFNVDTRVVIPNPPSFWQYSPNENGDFIDENGVYYKKTGHYCDYVKNPLSNAASWLDMKNFKPADPTDQMRFAGLRDRAQFLYNNTDKAIVGYAMPTIFYTCWCWRGHEQFFVDLLTDKKTAEYLLDLSLEWNISYMEAYLSEVGEYLDMMWVADDWGTQAGPLLHPDIFYGMFTPRLKRLIDKMKSKSNAKVVFHSCGSIMWAIDGLIDAGVDILQPLQPGAKDMDPIVLKREYGKRMIFHGGMDNQGTFNKSMQTLTDDASKRMSILAKDGGYIFSSGHNIQADMPPENLLALFNIVRENGTYPLK